MRPIKIVGSDTDLHDYQVRIHLDRSNFPLEKCKPDGSDIRFRDDSGEILPYWIERWNAAEGVIWCKIPFIPAESSKFIWMIYGNPNAKSESNGNAVFELFDVQGIVGFWHMDEPQWTGAAGEVKDEAGVNHGTAHGGATTTSDAKYGRAGYFDGEDDYVLMSDTVSVPTGFTCLAWWKRLGNSGGSNTLYHQILGRLNGTTDYRNRLLVASEGNKVFGQLHDGSSFISSPTMSISAVSYNFIGFMWDGSYLYTIANGELSSGVEVSNIDGGTYPLKIGQGDNFFISNGIIDEVCVLERALTPTEVQILSKNYMQKMGSYFNVRKYVTPAPVVIV